jgi:hypothetical protein
MKDRANLRYKADSVGKGPFDMSALRFVAAAAEGSSAKYGPWGEMSGQQAACNPRRHASQNRQQDERAQAQTDHGMQRGFVLRYDLGEDRRNRQFAPGSRDCRINAPAVVAHGWLSPSKWRNPAY